MYTVMYSTHLEYFLKSVWMTNHVTTGFVAHVLLQLTLTAGMFICTDRLTFRLRPDLRDGGGQDA